MTNILAYQNQNIDNINTIGYIFCYSIGNIEIEREIFNTLYDKFYNTYLRLSREDSASYSKNFHFLTAFWTYPVFRYRGSVFAFTSV